jgi:anti-sigma regulatory factor (Ser/Thr protein kinase)/ABC-type transporter Mla MlaB component
VELARVAGDAYANRVFPEHAPSRTAERVCEQSLELLTRVTGYADDITLLATQRVAGPTPFEWAGEAGADALEQTRRGLGSWLETLDVGAGDQFAVQHAVGELVTNAVEHAYADGGGPVSVGARLDDTGELLVQVLDEGHWRSPDTGHTRGRGLAMARSLLDGLTISHDDGTNGTTVLASHRLARPAQLLTGSGMGQTVGMTSREEVPFAAEVDDQHGSMAVSGPLDASTAGELRGVLERATRGGTRPVDVDLSGVTLLASAGVQVLYDLLAEEQLRVFAPAGSSAQHVMDLVDLPYATERPEGYVGRRGTTEREV